MANRPGTSGIAAQAREGACAGVETDGTLHTLLERGLRAIVALAGAQAGAVRLLDEARGKMRLVASIGLPDPWVERERIVAADCGICGLAVQDNRLQIDDDGLACSRKGFACVAAHAPGPALALPLHSGGRAIGVFNLFFAPGAHRPGELSALLEPVSDMLDLVIDNARLEQERIRSTVVMERQILAGEMHDALAQGLAFMRMRMSLLHDALEGGQRPLALRYFDDVNASLGEAHARLRELITHCRSGMDQGLAGALESTARTFEQRTGVALRIDNRAAGLRLPAEQELEVYRIVQEALANVVKHAQARSARVVIEQRARRLHVSVEDDGRGVGATDPSGEGGHYGLQIMRERALRIGGELQVRRLRTRGTRVRLTMPAPSGGG